MTPVQYSERGRTPSDDLTFAQRRDPAGMGFARALVAMGGRMRVGSLIAAIVVCAATAAGQTGQVTSPPPVCFGFNESQPTGLAANFFYVPMAGGITVHFAAPASATIERIDIPINFCWCSPALVIDLFQTSALGVPPTSPPIATFVPLFAGFSAGFNPFLPAAPVVFTAGATYAVLIRATPPPYGGTCYGFEVDLAGVQLPYQFNGTAECPGLLYQPTPPTGQIGLMIQFRGTGCGPGPLASVTEIGSGCGDDGLPGSFPAQLICWTPPAMGSTIVVQIHSPFANTTAWVFWSVGINALGAPVSPVSQCLHYLDWVSLGALYAAGAEPLMVSPLNTGYLLWQATVPMNPSLVGVVIGIQAMVAGPAGTIPLSGGVFGQTTNALQFLIGF